MGQGFDYRCCKCGYEFSALLGVGYAYPLTYKETMQEAREGKLGEDIKKFLEGNPQGAIDPKNVVAQCKICGEYEQVQDLSMYIPKETKGEKLNKDIDFVVDFKDYKLEKKYDHKCSTCGGKMKILRGKALDSLTCPRCKSEMERVEGFLWD